MSVVDFHNLLVKVFDNLLLLQLLFINKERKLHISHQFESTMKLRNWNEPWQWPLSLPSGGGTHLGSFGLRWELEKGRGKWERWSLEGIQYHWIEGDKWAPRFIKIIIMILSSFYQILETQWLSEEREGECDMKEMSKSRSAVEMQYSSISG